MSRPRTRRHPRKRKPTTIAYSKYEKLRDFTEQLAVDYQSMEMENRRLRQVIATLTHATAGLRECPGATMDEEGWL